MAEEILVKQPFTKEMIKAGNKLLNRLEEAGLEVVAAFWLYTSENNEWRLMLACPSVDVEGQRYAYGKIWDALYGQPNQVLNIESTDTTVISPSDTLVRALASVKSLVDISGKRLGPTGINGIPVDDIYVYFIRESVEPLSGPRLFSK
jgi:hypothetical protein